jgi:hypothetical protein
MSATPSWLHFAWNINEKQRFKLMTGASILPARILRIGWACFWSLGCHLLQMVQIGFKHMAIQGKD